METYVHTPLGHQFRLSPQSRPILLEHHRDRNHNGRQTSYQGTCPLYPEILKHLLGKQGKPGGDARSENNIRSNGGCGATNIVSILRPHDISACNLQRKVRIDQVVETGKEDTQDPEPDQNS